MRSFQYIFLISVFYIFASTETKEKDDTNDPWEMVFKKQDEEKNDDVEKRKLSLTNSNVVNRTEKTLTKTENILDPEVTTSHKRTFYHLIHDPLRVLKRGMTDDEILKLIYRDHDDNYHGQSETINHKILPYWSNKLHHNVHYRPHRHHDNYHYRNHRHHDNYHYRPYENHAYWNYYKPHYHNYYQHSHYPSRYRPARSYYNEYSYY
ncbi:hypothetical protein A3Q56_06332 [Intoshia linei]|uniref:Uncharacterized protein n=1 Tax=Intoshia linei TaxID=1819745 RepID=A0A177AX50_9BILA|nr:hypothetical protein A3Q56_06332 [Intoshia linei]